MPFFDVYILYFVMLFFRNDGKEFAGSVYQRINDQLETGVQLSWVSDTNATNFGIASKYSPDKDSTIRVRAHSSNIVVN